MAAPRRVGARCGSLPPSCLPLPRPCPNSPHSLHYINELVGRETTWEDS